MLNVLFLKPFKTFLKQVFIILALTVYYGPFPHISFFFCGGMLRFQLSFLKIEKKFSEKLPYQFFVFGGFSTENPVWGPYFTPTLFCLSYIYCDVYLLFILYFK